jgi:ribosomal protein L30/L7E
VGLRTHLNKQLLCLLEPTSLNSSCICWNSPVSTATAAAGTRMSQQLLLSVGTHLSISAISTGIHLSKQLLYLLGLTRPNTCCICWDSPAQTAAVSVGTHLPKQLLYLLGLTCPNSCSICWDSLVQTAPLSVGTHLPKQLLYLLGLTCPNSCCIC